MKHIFTLLILFTFFTFSATAQFSIQPQIGLENSRTNVKINDESFVPAGLQFAPHLGVKMNYNFKKLGGPFVGVSTSSSVVDFKFTDPQTAATSFKASGENLQFRFEGGYQFKTKPIYFSKPGSSNRVSNAPSHGQGMQHFCAGRMVCGHHGERGNCNKNSNRSAAKNKGWFMRIAPSAGLAFIPSQSSEIETHQASYDYKAGAWNTAFIAGTGFEFGVNRQTKFIININYLKGLDNMNSKNVSSMANGKSVATMFSSKASSFNVSLGIPISFNKKKPEVKNHFERSPCQRFHNNGSHGKCGQYRNYFM